MPRAAPGCARRPCRRCSPSPTRRKIADADTMFPDERLKLLFVCAHPAIAEASRTPLMLQTVLGLDAARIASAFLVQPAAMGDAGRAKAKIATPASPSRCPKQSELPPRLDAVLEAIYAAYGSGWDDVAAPMRGAGPGGGGDLSRPAAGAADAGRAGRRRSLALMLLARRGGRRGATRRAATSRCRSRTTAAGRRR